MRHFREHGVQMGLFELEGTYRLAEGAGASRDHWSAAAGWLYMNIDLEKGSGARTRNADLKLSGPFLGITLHL